MSDRFVNLFYAVIYRLLIINRITFFFQKTVNVLRTFVHHFLKVFIGGFFNGLFDEFKKLIE
jgi:hypothetical protein